LSARPTCPYCGAGDPWKGGFLPSGHQQYRCSSCRRQFHPRDEEPPSCPRCERPGASRHGKLSSGKQRWRCLGCKLSFGGDWRSATQNRLRSHQAEIVAMRKDRKSWAEIGKHFGCGGESVRMAMIDVPDIHGMIAPGYKERLRLERGGEYLVSHGETHARREARERRAAAIAAENKKWEKWPDSLAKPPEARRPAPAPENRAKRTPAHVAPILPPVVDPLRQPRRLHSGRDWEQRRAAALPVHPPTPVPLPEDPWPTGPVCAQPPADCDRCLRPLPLMRREGQARHWECRNKPAPPVGITRVQGMEQHV
jgi:transposase-like protein